jgi:hypothetical protein
MANSSRRNSYSAIPAITSHCHRCQLDIDADPQCNGRSRILCPFCGEFLTRPNLPDIQQLKQDVEVTCSSTRVFLFYSVLFFLEKNKR